MKLSSVHVLALAAVMHWGVAQAQPVVENPAVEGTESEFQISPRVRNATEDLDIDDATRARYRWDNGQWWFQTDSGQWMYHRGGQWQDFNPVTYEPIGGPWQGNRPPSTFARGSRPGYSGNNSYRPYYRYGYDGYNYNGPAYRDGYYGGGYYRSGYGPRSSGFYDSGTDRYYGRDAYGRGYSVGGDQYRGGVIGSEIGGRLGGRTGAAIGGAIGAEAAD